MVDATWVCIICMPYGARVSASSGYGVEYGCNHTHIRRGFCVAHSIGSGNARASGCGMGDGYRFPRFLLYMININQNYGKCCALGVGRHKKLSIMNKFLLSLMSFLMMTMCVCSFTACSSDDDDDDAPAAESVATSPIVGTWVERYDYNTRVVVTTFVFGVDGKGTMSVREEYSNRPALNQDPVAFNYTYNAETEVIKLKFDGDGTLYTGMATITGSTLMLSYNSTYYSLTKQ